MSPEKAARKRQLPTGRAKMQAASNRENPARDREETARDAASSEPAFDGEAHAVRDRSARARRDRGARVRSQGLQAASAREVASGAGPSNIDGCRTKLPLPYCNRRIREARLLAWCGVTEPSIAAYFGITVATLAAWKNEHPKLEAAILSGQRAQASGRVWDAKARRDAIALLGKPAPLLIDSGKATDKAPR